MYISDPDFSCGCTIQPEVVQEVLADLKMSTNMLFIENIHMQLKVLVDISYTSLLETLTADSRLHVLTS